MAITKNDIAEKVSETLGLNRREAKEIVKRFFEIMSTALENGHVVKLSGFGKFMLRDKRARPGRNPMTGEPKIIAERRVVTFQAGQKLKNKVMKYVDPEKAEITEDANQE